MKKTNKDKIYFNSKTILELNNNDLNNINGGGLTDFIESIIRVTTYGTWIDHGPLK